MDNQLWNNFEVMQEYPDLRPLPFSSWPYDIETSDQENLFAPPLMQNYYSDPLFPPQDLFQDNFSNIFDGDDGFWGEIIMDASMLTEKDISIINDSNEDDNDNKQTIDKNDQIRAREERVLTFEEVSRYFSMPIIEAAKELDVGLTLLKKKCRELGIPRWPHRKMKSMQTLIKNVQELGCQEGSAEDLHVKSAIELLEQEKKLMEIKPSTEMHEKTKRLRQACFKANYKKRRLMGLHGNRIS